MRRDRLVLILCAWVASATAVAGCSAEEPGSSPDRSGESSPSPTSGTETDAVEQETRTQAALTGRVVAERVGVPRQLVPLDERRTLIVDQRGLVHVLEGDRLARTPFLDLRDEVLVPA